MSDRVRGINRKVNPAKWRSGWQFTLPAVLSIVMLGSMLMPVALPEMHTAYADIDHVGDIWEYAVTYGASNEVWTEEVLSAENADGGDGSMPCYKTVVNMSPQASRVAQGQNVKMENRTRPVSVPATSTKKSRTSQLRPATSP